jgi:single-strand DNA-binding protein
MSTMITIAGNLGERPELSVTPNGKATTRLRVAVDSRHRTAEGQWVDGPTSWYTVIAWDRLAENVVEHGRKGDRVLAHGRLEQRDWTTDAGESRTAWEITAEDIGLSLRLAAARGGASGTRAAPPEPPVPEQPRRATAQSARQNRAIANRNGAHTRA